ncbi:hypothetical protein AM493_05030 [Flavobacterium akiainvivens]|uniref:Nitronate monooxygenase n=1 Tax=Flavobacterium akiainvivens TaxID=1202724 RepID=A0A0M8MCA8_9FLAO|nr:hypothetical protein AM493_05030 [Flavobacterium akiainvivens]
MTWPTSLLKPLKIQYPIIQAPMLGITTPEMVAAISNAGGLGSLPVGGLSPEKTQALIQQTKQLTDKPFAVNLFVHDIPEVNTTEATSMLSFLKDLSTQNNLVFDEPDINSLKFYSYKEQIDVLLEENISIISFTFGIPDRESIDTLKANNVFLIGTATSVNEAILLEKAGVDAISVQGIEAGGHRGSFINEPLPQIGLMALLPQVVDAVKVPVIASGAIKDGRTIKAALVLGAQAVQVGSVFLACNESLAIPAYKNRLANIIDTETQLTRVFSGRWARGISNKMMDEITLSGLVIPPYPIMNSLTTPLRVASQKADNADYTNLWAGQAAGGAQQKPATQIFTDMVHSFESLG